MTTKRLLWAALLGVALSPVAMHAGSGLHAHGMHGLMEREADPGMGMMFPLIMRSLGLNDEQKARVQTILQAHRPKFHDLFTQLRTAHDGVAAKLFSPGPVTAADLKSLTAQVAKLREQLMQEGVSVALEVRAVLTPDQLAKASDIRQKMESLHTEMKKLLGDPEMAPLDAYP